MRIELFTGDGDYDENAYAGIIIPMASGVTYAAQVGGNA